MAVFMLPVALESLLERGLDATPGVTLWSTFMPLLSYV